MFLFYFVSGLFFHTWKHAELQFPARAAFQFARRQWGRHLDCVTSRGHMADGRWLRSSTWHWCSVMLYCVYIYADAYRILYAFIDVGLMYAMLCSILQGCPILTDSLSQISLERPWSTQLRMTIVKTCQLDVDGWLKDWSNHPNARTYVQWTGPCYIACTAFDDVYIYTSYKFFVVFISLYWTRLNLNCNPKSAFPHDLYMVLDDRSAKKRKKKKQHELAWAVRFCLANRCIHQTTSSWWSKWQEWKTILK